MNSNGQNPKIEDLSFKADTILITGANGFFASRFIEYYKEKYNIIALKRNDLDITDENKVMEEIKKYNPNYVIHTAAIADTNLCETNPKVSFEVNVRGAINIAKACSTLDTKLMHLSSEQVYNGNDEDGPYSEESIAVPNTVYGKHKIEAEKEILKISDKAIILRLTWLFGLPERNKKVNANIIWNVLKTVLKNEPIKLPIHEHRGMTYVYDLLDNFPKIINLPGGIYNTGSENDLNTYEVGEVILKEMGLEHRISELLIKDVERYKTKSRDLRISNAKFKENQVSFLTTEEAIRKCIKEFSLKMMGQ